MKPALNRCDGCGDITKCRNLSGLWFCKSCATVQVLAIAAFLFIFFVIMPVLGHYVGGL
jgi:hypothetical protein